ncbi:MAG: 3-keto-disaccharide hydrolase [Opitutaceae bacterium]
MKTHRNPVLRAAALLLACAGAPLLPAAEWQSLFDGKTFAGWTFDVKDGSAPEAIWSTRDGVLVVDGQDKPPGVIRTTESYENYELELEWRWPGKPGNCGVLVHCSTPRRMSVWPQSLEVQLAHENAGDFWMIGETIVVPETQISENPKQDRRRLNLTDDSEKPAGEWNTMRIVARGDTVTVHVNGERVNHGTDCSAAEGAIALQAEGADIEFRNIRLRSTGE